MLNSGERDVTPRDLNWRATSSALVVCRRAREERVQEASDALTSRCAEKQADGGDFDWGFFFFAH